MHLLSFAWLFTLVSSHNPPPLTTDTCKRGVDKVTGRTIYLEADQEPSNEGGEVQLLRRMNKMLHYPDSLPSPVETTFVIGFIVEANGAITGERVISGSNEAITKQIYAVVRSFRWLPGKCHGKNVAMLCRLPLSINFQTE